MINIGTSIKGKQIDLLHDSLKKQYNLESSLRTLSWNLKDFLLRTFLFYSETNKILNCDQLYHFQLLVLWSSRPFWDWISNWFSKVCPLTFDRKLIQNDTKIDSKWSENWFKWRENDPKWLQVDSKAIS